MERNEAVARQKCSLRPKKGSLVVVRTTRLPSDRDDGTWNRRNLFSREKSAARALDGMRFIPAVARLLSHVPLFHLLWPARREKEADVVATCHLRGGLISESRDGSSYRRKKICGYKALG